MRCRTERPRQYSLLTFVISIFLPLGGVNSCYDSPQTVLNGYDIITKTYFAFTLVSKKKKERLLQKSWWRTAPEHLGARFGGGMWLGGCWSAGDGRWDRGSCCLSSSPTSMHSSRSTWTKLRLGDVSATSRSAEEDSVFCLWSETSWLQRRLSLCPPVCPVSCLLKNLMDIRLNVLCTDVNVGRTLNRQPVKTCTSSTCCWCLLPW